MDLPQWITAPYLGSFRQDYSFDLYPVLIYFSAGAGSKVTVLNGSLPAGLSWIQESTFVSITGATTDILSNTDFSFTFRIRQTNGTIADRTFSISITLLIPAPSWQDQPTFLGYQSNNAIATYQLTAIPSDGYHVTYGIVNSTNDISAAVIQQTGLLTVKGLGNPVSSNVSNINVFASSANISTNLEVAVKLLETSAGPQWYTPPGSLGNFLGGTYIEIQLVAEDPSGALVSYSLASHDQNWAIFLSTTGVVYGRLSKPTTDVTTFFTVTASTFIGSANQQFSITINPVATAGILSWLTSSDLGEIDEASQINISISAVSTTTSRIRYNVTGGMLPPHLILGTTDGIIRGFCEYHAVSKSYYFDVTASDGQQSVVRQFKLSVKKIYSDQYFGIDIPLTGDIRSVFLNDVANVSIREPGTTVIDRIEGQINYPKLTIVDGLVTGYDGPNVIINSAMPWLRQLDLNIGFAANSTVQTDSTDVIYRYVIDNQSNSSPKVNSTSVQISGKIYPISINNIRNSLINQYQFVSGGSGTGCILEPVLDWSTGGLVSVTVTNSGVNYVGIPNIDITGSGTGAAAHALLGLVSIGIADIGQSWNIGDEVYLAIGIFSSPARIIITDVSANCSIAGIDILDQGSYQQVGSLTTVPISLGVASATITVSWGVSSVVIDSAGSGYECNISVRAIGYELLPAWQDTYQPIIALGAMNSVTTSGAISVLNNETNSVWGTSWQPNYFVFRWQGLNWIGKMSLDSDITTFDGDTTRFEDSHDAYITVFDSDSTNIDKNVTIFDYKDPIAYDLFQVWGSTIIDAGTTPFDLYSTIFDALSTRTTSNTLLQKWIKTTHKTYTSGNAAW